jgi:hypothetical protein
MRAQGVWAAWGHAHAGILRWSRAAQGCEAALFIGDLSACSGGPVTVSVDHLGRVRDVVTARDEVDGGDGAAVHGSVCAGHRTQDHQSEVVVELVGDEGAGGLDDEGAGVPVEGDGVGVAKVGLVIGRSDFKFERLLYGSPYFFYWPLFFVVLRAGTGSRG